MKAQNEKVALVDMDGTLVAYDEKLQEDLKLIAGPNDPPLDPSNYELPAYLEARRHMITSQTGWWLKLKKFKLGWDVLDLLRNRDWRIVVLTKGPSSKPSAWSEKMEWCSINLPDIEGVTITHDKGLVYGKVLVDDFPDYILRWLKWRPRGLVIMPAHPHNENFHHPNVVRYNGTNLDEVEFRLKDIELE